MPDLGVHIWGGREVDISRWHEENNDLENLYFYGFVPPRQVSHCLVSVDVLLVPYQERVTTAMGTDTSARMSPLKIFEYMSVARPIVASDLPVLHEVLENGANALLCEPSNVDAWCEAIECLRESPEQRAALATRAYAEFLDQYTWQARASNMIKSIVL